MALAGGVAEEVVYGVEGVEGAAKANFANAKGLPCTEVGKALGEVVGVDKGVVAFFKAVLGLVVDVAIVLVVGGVIGDGEVGVG